VNDSATPSMTTYQRLAAPFDTTFHDNRGGVDLEYITGEQCVSRLNDVLGVAGWSTRVLQHDINAEADEAWALVQLIATIDGVTVTREQFGSQKLKRSRATGAVLDIGFDLKGAATDALKKCSSLLGVGLYLHEKEPPREQQRQQQSRGPAVSARGTVTNPPPPRQREPAQLPTNVAISAIKCKGPDCPNNVEATSQFGKEWSPADLANAGARYYKRPLCASCFEKAGGVPAASAS
jgi:hypothetical protein